MFLRSFITSGFIAILYTILIAYLSGNQLPLGSTQMYVVMAIFWSMGFFSIMGFIYGRKIKRNFRGETGTIKWFDPSKGYGFLIRDKGGDLFVHLRSVQTQDRRKLKENTRVRFSVENTEKGPQAENIRII
ncbi:MAG TPA: cold shock domain-containing protein [SAR86 cluster bacterium]|jgi:CspA family cold shock protein|nr:cold shock domain-containing protein [SAR86 cluster bacterium]|tara:strand:- start:10398 stop:10790 length:393 start_codon:yes stop_codon:yes gene_type:complete